MIFLKSQKYSLRLENKIIDDNCYKYQFYDTTDNRIKFAKIYSPFSHLKSGFVFEGDNDAVKSNKVFIQLVQNYSKIHCVFLQNAKVKWEITLRLYRDVNAKFVKETQRNGKNRWWATNPNLVLLVQNYKNDDQNREFRVGNYMKHMYYTLRYRSFNNGKWKVIGTPDQRFFNGKTQPFIQKNSHVEIKNNESFYIVGAPEKKPNTFKSSILEDCTFIGAYTITGRDKQEINKLYPNFSFKYLSEHKAQNPATRRTQWKEDD